MVARPQPKQEEALQALFSVPILFFGGAKGGGKSWIVRYWMIMRRLKYPGTTGVIIRKTYPELSANHIRKFWQEYPQLKRFYNKSEKSLHLPNGSTLDFRYLAHPDDVYNYQGIEYDDIGLDECTQHPEDTFKVLRSSNRTINPNIKPKFLLTGNPGGVGHMWTKRVFVERNFNDGEKPTDFAFVQAYVYDNDILMRNDPDYVRRLEALPETKRKAYLEGDWDIFEGQAFGIWRQSKHVIKKRYDYNKIPDSFTLRVCWDEGSLAPRAVYVLAQDRDGVIEVIWEYYKAGETTDIAAENIKAQMQRDGILELLQRKGRLIYDPALDIKSNQTGRSTSEIVHNILNISIEKGNNDREEGFRRFQSFLHWDSNYPTPLILFWECCQNAIRTIPALLYDGNGREDIDSDSEDHAYDAIRYGLMSLTRLPVRMKRTNSAEVNDISPPEWWVKRRKSALSPKQSIANPLIGF